MNTTVRGRAENSDAIRMIGELEESIERVDFWWEKGFISPEEYVQKRSTLQKEIEALRPVDYDTLTEAFDLIRNFAVYWKEAQLLEEPDRACQKLMAKIVAKVFVYDRSVVAIVLHDDFGVVLNSDETTSGEVVNLMRGVPEEKGVILVDYTQHGVDGIRTRGLRRDRATC